MTIYSLTKGELSALARVTELFEELLAVLSEHEMYPRDHILRIDSEISPGHVGWIGYDEGGCISLQLVDSDAKEPK